MSAKKRWRPLWVVLHWLMAGLVCIVFGIGIVSLGQTANPDKKLVPLSVHMLFGNTILLLVIARYILRVTVFKPTTAPPAGRKMPLLDRLSYYVHPLLYLFTALMSVLGMAISIPAHLFEIVILRSGAALPADFFVYPARAWHGTISVVLMLLVAQHVLVAVDHQFIRGENFLGRMWFSKH